MIDRIESLTERASRHYEKMGWPFVTLTYAQSLDGSITAQRGTQLQISGAETKQFTHQLRSVHDAILVGIGTVLADDPKLTSRRVQGRNPQPVILDSHARLPLDCDLLHHPTHRPWVAVLDTTPSAKIEAIADAGASVIRLSADDYGRVSISALLDALGKRDITSLMVEGGAQIITSFLQTRLVDQVIITIAPILVGGLHAVESLSTPFPRLTDLSVEQMGTDVVMWGKPIWEDQ